MYAAEKVIAAGSAWHKQCMRCADCKSGLDSVTLRDHEGEIYCQACHAKSFGPHGFRGGTAGGQMHTQ